MNVKVTVIGEYQHQAALIASNHVTWLDVPVLGSALPSYFLSKAEVRNIPIVGWLALHGGTLFVKRGGGQLAQVKDMMEHYLSKDHCLTLFPEATTGNGYAIRQFHPRLFAAAIDTDTPVIPVSICYSEVKQPNLTLGFVNETMAQNLWRVLARWRTEVTVTVLPDIQTGDLERKILADTAMNMIADNLNLPPERRGLGFRVLMPEKPQ